MAYSERVFAQAEEILQKRRDAAEAQAEKRREEFFRECPEAREVDTRMRSSVLGLVKVIGYGGNAQEYIEKLREVNLSAQTRMRELLARAGKPADLLEVHYTCPLCEDRGVYKGKLCQCRKQLLKQLSYRELSGKSSLAQKSFEDFSLSYYSGKALELMEKNLEFCKNYAANFGPSSSSILMTGETGLGKTHLSLAIAGTVIEKGYGVVYGSVQGLFGEVEREHFGRSNNPDGSTEDALISCDLLILDDLGAEFTTQFVIAELNYVIEERLNAERPTIINTNLTLNALQEKYSRRIVSRLTGEEYAVRVFAGNDIRSIKKRRNGI